MTDAVERDLAARFERLRSEDDSRAPRFRAVYEAARRNAPRRGRVFLLIAAAAAVPIVIALLLLHHPGEPALSRPDANAIAAWKSPTESLLNTPGSELYGEAPPVVEPIPEWIFETRTPTRSVPPASTPSSKGASS